jgi:activating signal cointegrator 1
MKCLTLTQPWATLVAIGAKKIETRSWPTNYRGPLAIHAAKGFPKWAREFASDLEHIIYKTGETPSWPTGVVLATCELVHCAIAEYIDVDPIEREYGDYSADRWAWMLEDVQRLDKPIPAKGMLGLWEWDDAPLREAANSR